jgi:hypothetical protein
VQVSESNSPGRGMKHEPAVVETILLAMLAGMALVAAAGSPVLAVQYSWKIPAALEASMVSPQFEEAFEYIYSLICSDTDPRDPHKQV